MVGYRKHSNPEKKDYSEHNQLLYLSFMLSDATAFALSQPIINVDYFDDPLKPTVRFLINYYNDYRTVPNREQVRAETGIVLSKIDDAVEHRSWFLDEIEQFCRHRALELVIMGGVETLQEQRYGEIEQAIKDAMVISLQQNLGIDYFADPKARLQRMREKSNFISSGWRTLDEKLYGGFAPGTLNIFAGQPGAGKSIVLQNLSLNYAMGGYNVIYFSLELSEDLVCLRLDAMTAGMATREVLKQVDEADARVRLSGKKAGKLHVKKLPEAGTTVNDLRACLKQYQDKQNLIFDVIVVDYLDLMYPNNDSIELSNAFVKDKFVSEELRAFADENHAILITASQLNRGSFETREYEQSHVAGGISKINTCDNFVAIFTTTDMKERGEYQFQFLKTRTSSAVGQRIMMKYDPATMRIADRDAVDPTKPVPTDSIAENVEKKIREQVNPEAAKDDLTDILKRVRNVRNSYR